MVNLLEEIVSMTLIKTFTYLPKLFLSEEQRCVVLLKAITLIKPNLKIRFCSHISINRAHNLKHFVGSIIFATDVSPLLILCLYWDVTQSCKKENISLNKNTHTIKIDLRYLLDSPRSIVRSGVLFLYYLVIKQNRKLTYITFPKSESVP